MAKSRTKEIAREKTPQERVKDSYSYEKACNAAKNSGTPTYHFAVGDRVQVGHLPNCVVEEVMDDGAMYLIRVTTKNNVEYSCWAWTSVRPLDDDKDTHFAKRDSALSRLHYSNRSMYSLLSSITCSALISNPIISAVLFGMRRTERNCWTASSQDAKLVVSSSSSCPLIAQTTMATTTKSSMASSVC